MCAAALHVEWTKTATTSFIETLQQHPCIWRATNTEIETNTDIETCGLTISLWNRAEEVNGAHSEFRREAQEVLWNRGFKRKGVL